jgi:hypothetical protein
VFAEGEAHARIEKSEPDTPPAVKTPAPKAVDNGPAPADPTPPTPPARPGSKTARPRVGP